MSFSSTVTSALFANSDELGVSKNMEKFRNRVAEKQLYYQNDESPFAEAQKEADIRMASKQRNPMIFEYLAAKNTWVMATFYINPNKFSIQTQKIKGKQVTRGGIYYHHHGDDHWTISLSGTTGFAMMKGIESLEKVYHASGTLLKYKTFGPEKVDIIAGAYGIIDYKDTIGVLDTFTTIQNPTILGKIQAKYKEENNASYRNKNLVSSSGNALKAYAEKIMDTYIDTVKHGEIVKKYQQSKKEMNVLANEFKTKNGRTLTATEYYNHMVSILQKNMGSSVSPDVVVSFAYSETLDKFAYRLNSNDYVLTTDDLFKLNYTYAHDGSQFGGGDAFQKAVDKVLNPVDITGTNQIRIVQEGLTEEGEDYLITDDYIKSLESSGANEALINALKLQKARTDALRNHLVEIANWEQRERNIKNELKNKALETMDDMFNDEWAPRRVILYYENRAYIGHLDSFSYSRVAENTLISYDIKFTVEKQIVGKMY